VKTRTEFS